MNKKGFVADILADMFAWISFALLIIVFLALFSAMKSCSDAYSITRSSSSLEEDSYALKSIGGTSLLLYNLRAPLGSLCFERGPSSKEYAMLDYNSTTFADLVFLMMLGMPNDDIDGGDLNADELYKKFDKLSSADAGFYDDYFNNLFNCQERSANFRIIFWKGGRLRELEIGSSFKNKVGEFRFPSKTTFVQIEVYDFTG